MLEVAAQEAHAHAKSPDMIRLIQGGAQRPSQCIRPIQRLVGLSKRMVTKGMQVRNLAPSRLADAHRVGCSRLGVAHLVQHIAQRLGRGRAHVRRAPRADRRVLDAFREAHPK